MKADGYILIDTKIVDGGMEKGFELIKDKMASVGITAKEVGEQIELSFSKMDVSKPIANAVAQVQKLEQQLASVTTDFNAAVSDGDDKSAERLVAKRIAVYDKLEAAREKLSIELAQAVRKEAVAEEKATQKAIRAAEKEAAAKQRIAEKQFNDLTRPARRFGSRFREIVSGALVFNLISAGLREMTSYFGIALKANTEFSASFAQLKGALLTAFQPIYEIVLPALISLMRVLTALVQVTGGFFSAITGKSSTQMVQNAKALNKQAGAIGDVGDAAEEASKQLAGFDEINRLESTGHGITGGGGGGSDVGEIMPNFEPVEITEDLEKILALVGAIGAGLVAWKIASMFTDSLSVAAGLGLAVGGAFLYAYGWADAFSNGINWQNLSEMLLGATAVVAGLAVAFGTTGSAVGLIVSGIGLVVVAIKDWIESGELGIETCAALAAGIAGISAAITLLTKDLSVGAGIGIAAGGALLYAFNWADAFANGISWENLSGMLAGVVVVVGGLASAFGTTGAAVGLLISGIGMVIVSLYDWISTGELSSEACATLAAGIMAIGAAISLFTGNWIPLMIAGVASAVTLIAGHWDELVAGAKNVLSEIYQYLSVTFADGFIHGLATMVEDAVIGLWNLFISFINGVIEKWNSIWGSINQYHATGTIGPQSYPTAFYAKTPEVPALARGAVLPANKPFLAMVGDQKNGTNVEAPLETIKQALAEVMGEYGSGDISINFTGDLAQLAKILQPEIHKQERNTSRARGW